MLERGPPASDVQRSARAGGSFHHLVPTSACTPPQNGCTPTPQLLVITAIPTVGAVVRGASNCCLEDVRVRLGWGSEEGWFVSHVTD